MTTATKRARTPGPWKLRGYAHGIPHIVGGNPEQLIAALDHNEATRLNFANADHIVQACNAWDDVEALRARLAELDRS